MCRTHQEQETFNEIKAQKMKTKTETSKMSRAIATCLNEWTAIWIDDRDVDMSIFTEYPKEREGIAVFMSENNSCVVPEFIRFYRSAKGMSIEPCTMQEYAEAKKGKLSHLLRRVNEV
jgi:3-polyprenyl-4-hydroxybenzoate decarboxylase